MAGLLGLVSCAPRNTNSDGSSRELPASITPTTSLTPADAASAWISAHPKEWVLAIDDADPSHAPQRPRWAEPCAEKPKSGFVALRYSVSDLEVDLFFRCPIDSRSSRAEVAAAFSHMVATRLPHGIQVPDWRFELLTPSSSFNDGVSFPAQNDLRWGIDVDTPLYAVRGDSTAQRCKTPADGSTPRECYVQIEHRIPLRLTLRIPYDPTALEPNAFSAPSSSASPTR